MCGLPQWFFPSAVFCWLESNLEDAESCQSKKCCLPKSVFQRFKDPSAESKAHGLPEPGGVFGCGLCGFFFSFLKKAAAPKTAESPLYLTTEIWVIQKNFLQNGERKKRSSRTGNTAFKNVFQKIMCLEYVKHFPYDCRSKVSPAQCLGWFPW